MGNVRLSELFHITERFQRSVHLERDFYTENALDGYVVTAKAREILTRLITAQEKRRDIKSLVSYRTLRFREIRICAVRCKTTRKF